MYCLKINLRRICMPLNPAPGVPRQAEFCGECFGAFFAREGAPHVYRLDVGGEAVTRDKLLAAVIALEVSMVFGVQLEMSLEDSPPAKYVLRADAAAKGAVKDVRVANVMAQQIGVRCRVLFAQVAPVNIIIAICNEVA